MQFRCDEVVDGVWRASVALPNHLASVNCYLLVDSGQAVLVDTAYTFDGNTEHISAVIDAAGVAPNELIALALTHTHIDHVGHIGALDEWLHLPTYVHPDESMTSEWASKENHLGFQAWLRGHGVDDDAMKPMLVVLDRGREPQPRLPRRALEGQYLAVGRSRWRVLHTRGHTPGHVCLYRESDGTLLTGDHLLPNESPNVSVRPQQTYDPLGSYLRALHRIANLPVQLGLPGHGEPFADVTSLVQLRLVKHDERLADAVNVVTAGEATGFAVAMGIPWLHRSAHFLDLQPRHQFLALGETLAHLELLEARAVVRRIVREGVTSWAIAARR